MRSEVERIGRRLAYKNRWMTVWEDQVLFQNGSEGIYGVVDKLDFSLIVPWDGSGFYLVEQYRYPVSGRYWEFPQGSLESSPEVDLLEVAGVELKEETGLIAESFEVLGTLFEAYGFSSQGFTVFLATKLIQDQSNLEISEMGMACRRFGLEEIWDLVDRGLMRDAPSIAALTLVRRYLEQT